MKKDKKAVAEAIMAGTMRARAGKPTPYFEGEEELDFTEGKPEKEEDEENIIKSSAVRSLSEAETTNFQ